MTDEQSTDDDRMDIDTALNFAADAAADEVEQFDGEVPEHAATLITSRASDLLQTLTNIEMAQATEEADDPGDEAVTGALEEDAVDILLALGALQYEHDLDIATAFEERKELIDAYSEFEAAVEDAETEEEAMEAFDEHMADHMDEDLSMDTPGVHAGMNVDSEDYDHDDTDKSFA